MKKVNLKKILAVVASVIVVFILLFALTFTWAVHTDKAPQFFPLNDPKGIYTITKKCPEGQWSQDKIMKPSYAYCLEYKGDKVLSVLTLINSKFFRVTIGNSEMDLAKYQGKNVTEIKGEFVNGSIQCIKNKCINLRGSNVVLNIDSLRLSENQDVIE